MAENKLTIEEMMAKVTAMKDVSNDFDTFKTKLNTLFDDVTALKDRNIPDNSDELNKVKGDLTKVQAEMLKFSEKEVKDAGLKHYSEQIKAQLTTEKYTAFAKGDTGRFKVEAVAGDMGMGTNVGDIPANTPIFAPLQRGQIADILKPDPTLLELIPTGTASSNTLLETFFVNEDGDPVYIGEVDASPKLDFDMDSVTFEIKDAGAHMVVSENMRDDIDWIMTKINMNLVVRLRHIVNVNLRTGDGTGVNISGLRVQGTPFSGTASGMKGELGTVDSKMRVEIIMSALTHMRKIYHTPERIVMNPTDLSLLKLQKDSNKAFVFTTFADGSLASIDGVQIIIDNNLTAGEFEVIEFKYITNFIKKNFVIDLGWSGTDFIDRQFTIRIGVRHALVINPNYKGCYIWGTYATAVTELNA